MSSDNSHYTHDDNPYLSVPTFFDTTGEIDPAALFETPGKLELEIGFGRGRFIRRRAAVDSAIRILGIETKRKLVYLCGEKAKDAGLSNLLVMHGDAREVVTRMQPDGCFDSIFVHFPDPWWKAKHQKRKVVTDALTNQVVRLLKPGGHYFVQTDVEFRAQEYHIRLHKVVQTDVVFLGPEYQQVLLANDALQPEGADGLVDENPFEARSSREDRSMELGMPVHRLLFTKK